MRRCSSGAKRLRAESSPTAVPHKDFTSFPWIFGFGRSSAFRAQECLDAGLCQEWELNGFIPDQS